MGHFLDDSDAPSSPLQVPVNIGASSVGGSPKGRKPSPLGRFPYTSQVSSQASQVGPVSGQEQQVQVSLPAPGYKGQFLDDSGGHFIEDDPGERPTAEDWPHLNQRGVPTDNQGLRDIWAAQQRYQANRTSGQTALDSLKAAGEGLWGVVSPFIRAYPEIAASDEPAFSAARMKRVGATAAEALTKFGWNTAQLAWSLAKGIPKSVATAADYYTGRPVPTIKPPTEQEQFDAWKLDYLQQHPNANVAPKDYPTTAFPFSKEEIAEGEIPYPQLAEAGSTLAMFGLPGGEEVRGALGLGAKAMPLISRTAEAAEAAAKQPILTHAIGSAAESASDILGKVKAVGEKVSKLEEKIPSAVELGAAALGGKPVLGMIAAVRGLENAGKLQEVADFAVRLAKADPTSPFGRLYSVASDPAAPQWMKVVANSWAVKGLSAAAQAGETVTKGAIGGAALGAAFGAATGQTYEDFARSIGVTMTFGGVGGLASVANVHRANILKKTAGKAEQIYQQHIADGVTPEEMSQVSDDALVFAASIQDVLPPGVRIRFAAQRPDGSGPLPSGPGGAYGQAGLWDGKTCWVNLSSSRDPGATVIHEVFHPVFDSLIADHPEIKTSIDKALASTGQDLQQAKQVYAQRVLKSGNPLEIADYIQKKDADSLVRSSDPNHWAYSEFLNEVAVQALYGKHPILEAMNRPLIAPISAALDAVSNLLEKGVGVKFNEKPGAGGRTPSVFPGFEDTLATPSLRKLTYSLLRVQKEWRTGPMIRGETGIPVTREMAGRHPAAPVEPQPDGRLGNDRYIEVKPGTNEFAQRSPSEQSKRAKYRRDVVNKIYDPNAPVLPVDDPGTVVQNRVMPSGGVERYGKELGPMFYGSDAFSQNSKNLARFWEQSIRAVTPVQGWVTHIGETAKDWEKSLNKDSGDVSAVFHTALYPYDLLATKQGNVIGRAYDMGEAMNTRAADWASRHGPVSLDLWGGDMGRFRQDIQTVLKNHAEGLPGEANNIGVDKKNVINIFLNGVSRAYEARNPLRRELKGGDKQGLVRSFRIDRLETLEPAKQEFTTPQYGKLLQNLSPGIVDQNIARIPGAKADELPEDTGNYWLTKDGKFISVVEHEQLPSQVGAGSVYDLYHGGLLRVSNVGGEAGQPGVIYINSLHDPLVTTPKQQQAIETLKDRGFSVRSGAGGSMLSPEVINRPRIEIEGPDGKKYAATFDGYQDFGGFQGMGQVPQITALEDIPGATMKGSTTYGPSLEKKGFKVPNLSKFSPDTEETQGLETPAVRDSEGRIYTDSEHWIAESNAQNAGAVIQGQQKLPPVEVAGEQIIDQAQQARAKVAFSPVPEEQIEERRKGELVNTVGDKDLKLIHFSTADLKIVDPKFFGKGRANNNDLRGGDKSYWFTEGSPMAGDAGFFGQGSHSAYGATVSGKKIYDLRYNRPDPLGYFDQVNRWKADTNLQKMGYDGLMVETDKPGSPYYRNVVMLFKPQKVKIISRRFEGMKAKVPGAKFSPETFDYGVTSENFQDEKTLPDTFRKGGWAIVTGTQEKFGDGFAPQNIQANAQLAQELTAAGIKFISIAGNYRGTDQGDSFLLTGVTPEQALEIGKKYGQESVLVPQGLLYQNKELTPVNHKEDKFGEDALKQDFYSQIQGGPAFSLGLDFSKREKYDPKNYVIRHGETDFNVNAPGTPIGPEQIRGWIDIPLNDNGRKQAEKTAKKLEGRGITVIVSSDMQRTMETAHIIAKKIGASVQSDPGLRPWNLGEFQGKPVSEAIPKIKKYVLNPDTVVPGGESFNTYKIRFLETIRRIDAENSGTVGIVTHYRGTKLLDAWQSADGKGDEINVEKFLSKEGGEETAGAEELHKLNKASIPVSTLSPDTQEMFGRTEMNPQGEKLENIRDIDLVLPRGKLRPVELIASNLARQELRDRVQLLPNIDDRVKVRRAVQRGFTEILKALERQGKDSSFDPGSDWYRKDLAAMEETTQQIFPETKDPVKMGMFKTVLAVLSGGVTPKENYKVTAEAFSQYLKTSRVPAKSMQRVSMAGKHKLLGRTAQASIVNLNNLLQQTGGEAQLITYLTTQHAETLRGNKDAYGALDLGPKYGRFFLNMMGHENEVTVDLWATRTWNRWMGTPSRKVGINYEMQNAPVAEVERNAMIESFRQIAAKLSETTGKPYTAMDAQAVLWYYEKELYGSERESYEEKPVHKLGRKTADEMKLIR